MNMNVISALHSDFYRATTYRIKLQLSLAASIICPTFHLHFFTKFTLQSNKVKTESLWKHL